MHVVCRFYNFWAKNFKSVVKIVNFRSCASQASRARIKTKEFVSKCMLYIYSWFFWVKDFKSVVKKHEEFVWKMSILVFFWVKNFKSSQNCNLSGVHLASVVRALKNQNVYLNFKCLFFFGVKSSKSMISNSSILSHSFAECK